MTDKRRRRSDTGSRAGNSSGSRKKASDGARTNSRTAPRQGSRTKSKSDARSRSGQRGRGRAKRGFSSWSVGKKIAAILGGTLVLLITAGIVLIASKMGKINTETLNADALNISDEIEYDEKGYLNVALFGLDTRETKPEEGARSDTIMIASLNRETKEVKIASVFRDTLLQQSDASYNKANSAYSFDGAEGAVAMLNKNLDMNVQHYVTVDFAALVDVIDALGGIDINVEEEEIYYINGYAAEIIENVGVDTWAITDPGLQKLTGVQATAYARIRSTSGDDYRRAERQREVVSQIVKKAQASDLKTINKIIDKVFPKIETNFTMSEILAYAKDAMKYKLGELGGFPYEKEALDLTGIGSAVIPLTLESNVIELHRFFFGEDGYIPTAALKEISNEIAYTATGMDTTGSGEEMYYYDDSSSYVSPPAGSESGTGSSGTTGLEDHVDPSGGTGNSGSGGGNTTNGTDGATDSMTGNENYDSGQY